MEGLEQRFVVAPHGRADLLKEVEAHVAPDGGVRRLQGQKDLHVAHGPAPIEVRQLRQFLQRGLRQHHCAELLAEARLQAPHDLDELAGLEQPIAVEVEGLELLQEVVLVLALLPDAPAQVPQIARGPAGPRAPGARVLACIAALLAGRRDEGGQEGFDLDVILHGLVAMNGEGEVQSPHLSLRQPCVQGLDRRGDLRDRQSAVLVLVEKVQQILDRQSQQLLDHFRKDAFDPSRTDATVLAQADVETVQETVVVDIALVRWQRFDDAEDGGHGVPRDRLPEHRLAHLLPHLEGHEATAGKRLRAQAQVFFPEALPQLLFVGDNQLRDDLHNLVLDLLPAGVVGLD
mmetsp:Transcript_50755/g.147813  ORF Transcript_50755/g.147813 Transcript_50755/m.147813 type:complete len:346 (-) Transcript_50755:1353-2390(-)